MGLPPREFYRLQYSELVLMLQGYRERRQRESRRMHEEAAWIGSLILLPYTPKDRDPVSPAELLGRKPRRKGQQFGDAASAAKAFFAARKAAGKGASDAQ